jgi:hypothetical protein
MGINIGLNINKYILEGQKGNPGKKKKEARFGIACINN